MTTTFVQLLAAVLACAATAAGQTSSSSVSSPQVTTATVPPPGLPPSRPPQTGCPTVTSTREICSTCVVPACLALATVTQFCGCPTPVPTVFLDFPCGNGCSGLWCSTSFGVLSAEGTCTSSGNLSSSPSTTVTSGAGDGGDAATVSVTSFPGPSISSPPNGTSVTVNTRLQSPPPTPTVATQSGPPINAAGRPRPFRFWL